MLNEQGLILTNDHVIKGATSLSVDASGSSKKTTSATIVGEEANQDLALIKVDPSGLGLKPLDARELELGRRSATPCTRSAPPTASKRPSPKASSRRSNREIAAPDGAKISRRDPDRRGAQPGQLRRAAARRTGRGDRRQLPDRQRRGPDRGLPAREHRRRLRDLLEHRRVGREEDRGRGRGHLRVGARRAPPASSPRAALKRLRRRGRRQSPYGGSLAVGSESPYGEVEAGGGSASAAA